MSTAVASAAPTASSDVPRADGASPLSADFWLGRIDLRPVALFRIAFGLLLIFDLCDLAPNLTTFFTDVGLMPRIPMLESLARANRFALADAFSSPIAVHLFWLMGMVAAGCMVAGFHTRLAQLGAYLVIQGFNERLPQLFDGGDSVIRLALFWLLFVPSGNVWSVDSLRARRGGRVLDDTGMAFFVRLLQLQVGWVYCCTAWHKWGGSTWHDGTALHYVWQLEHVFSRSWVAVLADVHWLTWLGTHFTMVFEFGFLVGVLFPIPKWRPWVMGAFLLGGVGLHGGIAATVNVGLFSYLMPVTYLAFFEREWAVWLVDQLARFGAGGKTVVLFDGASPSSVADDATLGWMDRFNRLERLDARKGPLPAVVEDRKPAALAARLHAITPEGKLLVGWDAWMHVCSRLPATFALVPFMGLPVLGWFAQWLHDLGRARRTAAIALGSDPGPAPLGPEVPFFSPAVRSTAQMALVLALGGLFVSASLYASPRDGAKQNPPWAEKTVQWFGLWSIWDMFSPEPLRTDYHLRAPATFDDGSTIDLFGGPADGPGEIRGFWFSRWWKYLENVTGGGEPMPREWGRWMCRNHDGRNGTKRLYTFTLKKEAQIIPPAGQPWPPVQSFDVWIHRCFDKPGDKKVGS